MSHLTTGLPCPEGGRASDANHDLTESNRSLPCLVQEKHREMSKSCLRKCWIFPGSNMNFATPKVIRYLKEDNPNKANELLFLK